MNVRVPVHVSYNRCWPRR